MDLLCGRGDRTLSGRFVGEGGAGKSQLCLRPSLAIAASKRNWRPGGVSDSDTDVTLLAAHEPSVAVCAQVHERLVNPI